jgi:hypothetical protein
MFIGTPSLSRLAAFLRGYDLAMQKSGQGADPFLPNFRDWVQKRLRTTTLSWEDAILEEGGGEAEGVKRFWQFLEEYRREMDKQPNASKNGGPADSKLPTTSHSR